MRWPILLLTCPLRDAGRDIRATNLPASAVLMVRRLGDRLRAYAAELVRRSVTERLDELARKAGIDSTPPLPALELAREGMRVGHAGTKAPRLTCLG
jgi:hypothetical protein